VSKLEKKGHAAGRVEKGRAGGSRRHEMDEDTQDATERHGRSVKTRRRPRRTASEPAQRSGVQMDQPQ
jgi:hypothetical protein